jgi:hypothetical protein
MYKIVSFAVALTVTLASSLLAQAISGINGRIVDQGGAVLPGVSVSVVNAETGAIRETTTNAEGLYSVPALDRGTYEVQATLEGFAPASKKGIAVVIGSTMTVDLQMGLAALQESLTVSGQAPLVESTQSGLSHTILQTEVAQLPMLNRSLTAMMTLVPGAREVPISGSTSHGNAVSYVSFGGGSGRNYNMLVDGVENKEDHCGGAMIAYGLEGIEEFKVLSSGTQAQYGKGLTTVLLATKSGTNQFHGSVFGYGRNQDLVATDYFSDPAHGGAGKAPFKRFQFGGSAGGPIARDRAWFFGSIERTHQDFQLVRPDALYQQIAYLEPRIPGVKNSHFIDQPLRDLMSQGKVNFQLSHEHSLYARFASQVGYLDNDTVGTGQALLASGEKTNRNNQTMATVASGWTWIVNNSTVNQLTGQFLYWEHDNSYPNCGTPANCLSQKLSFPSVSTGPNNTYPHWYNREQRYQIKDDFSKQAGRHAWKVGADYSRLPVYGGIFALGSPGSIAFFDDPSTIVNNTNGRYPLGFQTPGIVRAITVTSVTPANYDELDSWSFGSYVQDDFKISPKLTLNAGVRYDVYSFMSVSEVENNRTYQVLKAIGSPFANVPKIDKNNIAPRVGIAWDLNGNGKNVVRGAFGLFFGQGILNTYFYPTVLSKPVIFSTQTYANAAIGVGQLANYVYGVTPLPPAPDAPTEFPRGQNSQGYLYGDPNWQDPLTRQFLAGFSHVFPHESVLSVDYTHIQGLHGWRRLEINPLLPDPNNPGRFARPLSALTAQAFGDPNLLGVVYSYHSLNESLYDEVAAHFERRFSRATAFQVNYTLAWARAMGGSSDQNNVSSPLFPQQASASGGDIYADWEFGPTSYDERHRVTVAGVFNLPYGIDVSPSFTAATARPYTQYRGVCTCGDGNLQLLGPDGLPVGINNARGLPLLNGSARVTKNFAFSQAKRLSVFAEFYNFLDRANFGNQYGSRADQPATYGKPIGYLGGFASTSTIPNSFQVQFGSRFSF